MMMMIDLYFLLLSAILVYSMLIVRFGSRETLLSELQAVFEREKSIWLFMKDVASGISAKMLIALAIGVILCVGSLIAFLFEILHIKDSPIMTIMLVIGFCGVFFSIGVIGVWKQELPGKFRLEGVPAVIMGGFLLLLLYFSC